DRDPRQAGRGDSAGQLAARTTQEPGCGREHSGADARRVAGERRQSADARARTGDGVHARPGCRGCADTAVAGTRRTLNASEEEQNKSNVFFITPKGERMKKLTVLFVVGALAGATLVGGDGRAGDKKSPAAVPINRDIARHKAFLANIKKAAPD